MAGEVFRTAQNALAMVSLDKGLRVASHHGRIRGKAAIKFTDHGIIRVGVHIDHRRQVERDAGRGQGFGQRCGRLARQSQVVLLAKEAVRHGRREAVPFVQSRHLAAFLVHRHQQRYRENACRPATSARTCSGDSTLRRRPTRRIEVKQHHPTQMSITNIGYDGMPVVHGQTAKAHQQHLPDLDFERDIGRSASSWG